MSVEKLVDTEDLLDEGGVHTLKINRMMTDGVIEAPMGAHFTECPPDYGRDEAFQAAYAKAARSDEDWEAFRKQYLEFETEAEYRKAVVAE